MMTAEELLEQYATGERNFRSADLTGADLSGADLTSADLTGATLSSATLVDAQLINAKLNGALLDHANLDYADLSGADLSEAVLDYANLRHAILHFANLFAVGLLNTRIGEADFRGANLTRALYRKGEIDTKWVNDAKIKNSAGAFVNAPNRLEFVKTVNGTDYINDSKASKVDSVYWALDAMDKPVILILCGDVMAYSNVRDTYRPLNKMVREKVKAIVCIHSGNQNIIEFFAPIVKNIEGTRSIEDAVKIASSYTEEGDTVLLSPGSASFGLSKSSTGDWGKVFKNLVLSL